MYHMTGDDFIDNQVKKLMEQFLNEHKDEISENYEIIFLKETDLPQQPDVNILILKENDMEVVPINRYINTDAKSTGIKNNNRLFNKLITNINKYK